MNPTILKRKHEPWRKASEIQLPKRVRRVRMLGNFLVLVAVVGLIVTFWPVFSAEFNFRLGQLRGKQYFVNPSTSDSSGQNSGFGQMLGQESKTILIPKSTEFGIVVEKIGANAPVIANVDASNKKIYNQALQEGVAHAAGTAFPGEKGITFLFAHSVLNPWDVPRYNAVFYLLRELTIGDRIIIFYQGRRFDYLVTEKLVVAPNNTSVLNRAVDSSTLVLQTCDPPGTTWRRLLIVAKLEKDL